MDNAIRRACDQCLGTDTQYECERGQCYAEHCLEQQAQENRYWQDRYDAEHGEEDQSHGG